MNMCSYQDTWTGRAALPRGFYSDRLRAADRGAGVIGAHPVLLSLQETNTVKSFKKPHMHFAQRFPYTLRVLSSHDLNNSFTKEIIKHQNINGYIANQVN